MKKLNEVEAICGFVAWIIAEKKEIVISNNLDYEVMLNFINEFCDVNELGIVRDGWVDNLILPGKKHPLEIKKISSD